MGYESFKIGNVNYPLDPLLAVNDADVVLDPAVDHLLNYIDFVLTRNLGDYWTALATRLGLTDYLDLIAEKIPYDPTYYFTASQYKLPLLCLFRTSEIKKGKTVHWYVFKGDLVFRYIFPPVDASQYLSVSKLLKAVRDIVSDRIEQGYDPNYLDGYGSPITHGNFGICEVGVTEVKFGNLESPENNMFFPCLELTINMEERENFAITTFDDLEGVDGTTQIAQAGNTEVLDFIEFQQDLT